MKIARKISSEAIKEVLAEARVDGTYENEAMLMMEEYAESVATDFCEWTQRNHFVYTTSQTDVNRKCWVCKIASIITTRNIYSTNQLYEQFMIERSRRTQNNECVIPVVMRSFSLEEMKEAFKAGQMQIWEDLAQTTRCAKFESFEEWFENYA